MIVVLINMSMVNILYVFKKQCVKDLFILTVYENLIFSNIIYI